MMFDGTPCQTKPHGTPCNVTALSWHFMDRYQTPWHFAKPYETSWQKCHDRRMECLWQPHHSLMAVPLQHCHGKFHGKSWKFHGGALRAHEHLGTFRTVPWRATLPCEPMEVPRAFINVHGNAMACRGIEALACYGTGMDFHGTSFMGSNGVAITVPWHRDGRL